MAHYPKIFDFSSTPIDSCEIAWGTGTGITSSSYFVFDCSRINLVMGGTSSLNSATNSVYLSSIIGGSCNIIKNATGSSIQATCFSCIYGNNFHGGGYSSIIAGYCNRIVSGTSSVVLGGTCNLILNAATNNDLTPGSPRGNNFITAGFSHSVCCSRESGIIGGGVNAVKDAIYSTIIGGRYNTSETGQYNTLIGGVKNCIEGSNATSIMGGDSNHSNVDQFSVFLGGKNNYMSLSKYSLISGRDNCIVQVSIAPEASSILNGSCNKIIDSCNSTVISSAGSTIENSKGSSILAGNGGQGYYKQGNTLVDSCSSILSGGKCVFDGVYWNDKVNKIYSSVSVNVIGGASNTATSSFGSTILAGYQNLICSSTQSSIIGGETNSIYQSSNSSIIGGSGSAILSSANSAIIGGFGLTISNENDVVYVSTLKIDSVTQSVSSNRYLIWDGDKCVRYTENTQGVTIDTCEIAWGTGAGITSSNYFVFDCSRINLVMGGTSSLNSATNSVYLSSIIGGFCNSIISSTSSSILASSCSIIATTSNYSSILSGLKNTIKNSCESNITGGSQNILCNAHKSSVIGGLMNIICNATSSSIISSFTSSICDSYQSGIISSQESNICNKSINSTIISSLKSKSLCSRTSTVLSSCFSELCNYAGNTSINNTIISSNKSCVRGCKSNSILSTIGSTVKLSDYSVMFSATNSCLYSSRYSILTGKNNCLCDADISGIILSENSNLKNSDNSFILGSMTGSVICDSKMSGIITSYMSCIRGSSNSVIIGGVGGTNSSLPLNYYGSVWNGTQIIEGNNNVIVGGGTYLNTGYFINSYPNRICKAYASSIISGRLNIIDNLNTTVSANIAFSGIFSGEKNTICNENSNNHTNKSSIIAGGCLNKIMSSWSSGFTGSFGCSNYSTIIGGVGNCIGNSQVSLISSSNISCIIGSQSLGGSQRQNTIISTQQGMICGRVSGNMIFGSEIVCITSVNDTRTCSNNIISSRNSQICGINILDTSGKSMEFSSVQNSSNSAIVDSSTTLIMNSANGTVSNSCYSHLLSTIGSLICNSIFSGIISSSFSTICNSIFSSIVSASGSCILNSSNSLILGGRGLTLSNERDTVYVSTLKINSVTQSIDTNRVLVWDCDSCVRYTTINAEGVIDICEIAWGTGVGITSSDHFRFDCQRCNLLMGCNQGPTFTHASSSYWSVNLGKGCNCITNSNSAVILGGCKQFVATSSYSSIIGGQSNTIWCSNYSSTIGGKFLTITESNYSTIINGSSSQVKSVFSTIISGICQCINTNSKYSSIVGGKCGCITTSEYSTIVGGFAGNSKNTIRNSDSSLVLNSTCYSLIGTSSRSMISNAFCSKIENSKSSLILGGCCDCIINQSYRSLVFGYVNTIDNSKDSIVLGNRNNCICNNSQCSTIISGCQNVIINNACDSIVIHGWDNCIQDGFKNSIINSDKGWIQDSCFSEISSTTQSCICNSEFSSIQASSFGKSCDNCHSALVATKCSCIIGKVGSKDYTFGIILGGCCHTIGTSSLSSIIGGYRNTINRGNLNVSMISSCCSFAQFNTRNSSIIGSEASCMITDVYNSTILGGQFLKMNQSKYSMLGASTQSCICKSNASVNIGGYRNCITENSIAGSLIGSCCGLIYNSKFSGMVSSRCSKIGNSDYSSVISSFVSCVCNSSLRSSIISSCDSCIITSTNSAIIGGTNSCIITSQNSAIIGGRGLVLSNENQVVYLPELKINKVDQCVTLSKFLVWDDTNKYVRWANSALEPGITGSTIFYTGTNWTYSSTNIYNNGTYVGIGLTNSLTNTYATPSSNLHVFGSLALDVKTASSDYTLTDRNFTLLASPPVGGMTVSLPLASLAKHRVYVIKKVNSSSDFVYINRSGSDTIEGYGGSITLESQWDYNILQSDGVNMWIKLGGAVGLNL